jgi:peptidoglycan hydrolase-like protein with peptidoglycan-binding domain/3D (Asp-Asp-Asp) domain-containing protein
MVTKKIHTHHIKPIFLIVGSILAFFAWYQVAHALYTKPFIISAYYSPIPGQERYVTGSYDGDIRLNGSGVNSADGTPVYPGMIAAPATYPFGTKMSIPGIGTVAVHDRGGAIVHAGQRGNSYDRLDVWMGYGDAGLTRALNWGKRTVAVTVYGNDPSIKENVYLQGFSEAEKFVRNIVIQQKIFKTDMGYGTSGDDVGKLQEYLLELGYYKGKIDNYYGDEVYKAVMAFQIDQDIVDRSEDFGAGYFGPQTRAEIEAVIFNRKKEVLPRKNLGKDDNGDEVKKLQEALQKLGYDVEINGIYDEKTINAVFKFQKEHEIVDYEDDLGAGYFGPRTFAVLSQKLLEIDDSQVKSIQDAIIVQVPFDAFNKDLSLGDKGDEVSRLQENLKKINLLHIDVTGYYGNLTKHAVFKFQQRKGIIASINDSGAGIFGPKTRNALNDILGYRANTRAIIASKTASYNERPGEVPETEKSPVFITELNVGSRGDEVALLQSTLKNLGFFKGGMTSEYFGETTQNAVIAFQIDQNLITSKFDSGAGNVGPKTREALNTLL